MQLFSCPNARNTFNFSCLNCADFFVIESDDEYYEDESDYECSEDESEDDYEDSDGKQDLIEKDNDRRRNSKSLKDKSQFTLEEETASIKTKGNSKTIFCIA